MISHFHSLTPTASFVYSDLFINDTADSYDIPINTHIVNHYSQDIVIILRGKDEDSSSYTGIALASEDILDLSGVGSHYQVGVKYLSSGSGTVLVSAYQFTTVTK